MTTPTSSIKNDEPRFRRKIEALFVTFLFASASNAIAQETPSASDEEDEVFVLSPFEVTSDGDESYLSTTTLAGNRLNADIRDLGTSLSIYNEQFMTDIGATDSRSLLQYTLGTEISGPMGNYSGSGGDVRNDQVYLNPQSTNRVRGLVAADSTRDLFLTSIPWDGYNINAVDIQRGPNAILFGQGSPAGVINTRTKQAAWKNETEISARVDEYGSFRASLDVNQVILEDQLAIRFAAVANRAKFKQDPAFEDVDRQYLALRFEPEFLSGDRAKTIFKADVEWGSSESNRPRNMPPEDRITPWFTELNKGSYNAAYMNNNNWQIPGYGLARSTDNNGNANPNYEPYVNTNFGNNFWGGAMFSYDGNTGLQYALVPEVYGYTGIGPDGERDGGINGIVDGQLHGIMGTRDWANATGKPFGSLWNNTTLTDPSVFDFYDKLLDGDIKREWYDFHAFDLSVSQTFFENSVGIDLAYHGETYKDGSYNPLGGGNGTLFVDYYSQYADGTPNAAGGWYTDAPQNPNAGRPFVLSGNTEGDAETERTSLRATAFATHDFDKGDGNWITRLLGSQTLTGVVTKDDYNRYSRNWVKSTFVGDYFNHPMLDGLKAGNSRYWQEFNPWKSVYIGPDLRGKNLGEDLGITGPTVDPVVPNTVMMRYFDPTWNAPDVDPADPWYNPATIGLPGNTTGTLSTQSENPANYVGWVTREQTLLTDETEGAKETLTTGKDWDDRYNDAWALVWQGKFWNESVVATAGYRHDEVGQTITQWRRTGTNYDPASNAFNDQVLGPVKEDTRSHGVVVHTENLPFLDGVTEKLPVRISLSYNESSNFQTGQIFTDYWKQELPLPKGETVDKGIVVATKGGKYSLRVNKFKSTVENSPSSGVEFWNYGNNIGIYASGYHQAKHNYESRGDPTSAKYGDGIISDLPRPAEGEPQGIKGNFDYFPFAGQTWEEAEAMEVATIQAWDQWLEEMSPLPQMMAHAWGFSWDEDPTYETGLDNPAFRFTSDVISEGYEIELHGQIVDNWRVTLNASRIESTRDNIGETLAPGGQMTMKEYLLDFDRRLNETAMGNLRIWGAGNTNPNDVARANWNGYANRDLKAKIAQEGTVVPENRLWHANLITNYDFVEGKFKGWSIGGAVRYQDSATLSYVPVALPNNNFEYDLNSRYEDSALTNFDLSVGYARTLFSDKVDWRCQLNINNVGVGEELIPVSVQPDGTPAAYYIRPPQYVFLTNTFSF